MITVSIALLLLIITSFPGSNVSAYICDSSSDISALGNILCHYSSVSGFTSSQWSDLSGNGNHLIDGVDMSGLTYYGNGEDYVRNLYADSGYIKFPTACNLPANGDYTLFTASMYYGVAPAGSRAFGNCDANTFVSGWYQPDVSSNEGGGNDYTLSVIRDNYVLHSQSYNVNGWIIVSDTMNSFRINGAEITHQIPVFSALGNNDVQMCFNYVDGATTNAPFRIKEYIVFDETLDEDETRCVEEYIFAKHSFWQHLTGLAP